MADKLQLGIVITADGSAAEGALGKVKKQLTGVKTATVEVSEAANLAKTAFAAMAGAFSVRAVIQQADAYAQMTARLKLSSGTLQEYGQALESVRGIAAQYQQQIDQVGMTYQRLAPSIQKLGMSQSDLKDILSAVSAGLKVSGTEAGAASGFLTQFAQALNSATVQAEEWNSIQDGNLALVNALEKQMPDLIAQYGNLKAAINAHAISNERLARAVKAARAELEAQAATMGTTMAGAMTVLGNAWQEYIGQSDQATGSSRELATAILSLAHNLDTVMTPVAAFLHAVAGGAGILKDFAHEAANLSKEMVGLKDAGSIDPELMRLMRAGSGQLSIAEIAGPPSAARDQQKAYFGEIVKGSELASQSLEKLGKIQTIIYATALKYQLDPALMLGLAKAESGFDPGILSKIKKPQGDNRIGLGLYQFIPSTGAQYGLKTDADRMDPVKAADAAARLLKDLFAKFPNDLKAVIAAWNAGPGAVQKAQARGTDLNRIVEGSHIVNVLKFAEEAKGKLGELKLKQGDLLDPKVLAQEQTSYYKFIADSLQQRAHLEDAAGQTRVAQQQAEFAKLKQAAEDAGKNSEIKIQTIIDTQGIGAAQQAINEAEAKQADYLKQMNTLAGGKDSAAVDAAARQVKAMDAMIAKARELGQWDEQGAKLTNERALAEEALKQARIAAGGQSLELEQALAENHAKFDALRQQSDEEAMARQKAAASLSQAVMEQAAADDKAAIDSKLEAARTVMETAAAEREAQAQNLTGTAQLAAQRDAINAKARDALNLVQLEKQAALDKLTVDQQVLDYQTQQAEAALQAATSEQDRIAIKKRLVELQGQAAELAQKELDAINRTPAAEAKIKTDATQQTAKLDTQNVREAQLEMNAFWDQYMQRIQDYAAVWEQVTGGTQKGFSQMITGAAQYAKSLEQISQKYTDINTGGKTRFAERLGDYAKLSEGLEMASASFGMLGQQFAAMASQQEKGSAAWKEYNAMAMASVAVAQVAALAQGLLAVATAMASDAKLGGFGAIAAGIAVAATLASFGIAMAGAGGGGASSNSNSAESRQASAGTGTVFGDSSAKSESIAKSLEIIRDNSSNDLTYSAAMLRALEGIEAAIKGTTNAALLNFQDLSRGMQDKGKAYGSLNSNTSVSDWGISFPAKKLFEIFREGLDRGATYVTNARSNDTSTANLDYTGPSKELNRAIRGVADALIEGGKAFGLSATDFRERLRKFVVDLGIISLKGLSGDDMQKQLSAIMSNLSDKMAKKFMPDLGRFQQVGEGYAQTFWRVAEGINRAKGEMEQLGLKAVDYKDIIDKQGDVAAEIVRQTLEQQGRLSEGVKQYVHELTGSAEDIIASYKKLVEASNLMNTAGFGDQNLNRTMINAAGGLDEFTSAMQDFNDNFLTEAQRFAGASQQLGEQFAALGVAMPASKDGFYQMLMGIDKTTEAGQKLFGALLKLNPEFAKLADQIQGIKDKYADILNPFGKIGAQIRGVGDDFNTLITDAAKRSTSTLDALTKNLNDQVADQTNRQGEAQSMLDRLNTSLASRQKQLTDAQAVFDREMAKSPKKRNTKALNQAIHDINEAQTAIAALQGFIDSSTTEIAGYKAAIDKLNSDYAGATGTEKARADMEKAGLLKDAATVMTKTLGDIFTEIQQTVDAARQKLEAAVTFQKALATQIASLQGPDATAALLRSRAAEATRAVDDYWANMSTGAKRNTDEELRLLGEAQQAIMDKYNAELAAVQQLQQAVDGFNGAIASLRSQIATLQGPGAVAALASRNYGTAFQNIQDYRAGITAGGTRDYAKEVTLIQAAQTAVMDRYNAEMALIQADVQLQAQALQDGLQTQIDAINTATQAQIDSINAASEAQIESINAASEARVEAINAEVEAQQQAAQTAHEAQIKTLQEQLQAAQRLTEAYKQIAEYAKSMKLGSLTNLSPEARLAEAQRQYQDTLAKARSGEADAAGKLTGASDAYLEAARAYYGSGTQYSDIFDGVQAAMASVGGLDGGNPDSIQAHIDALNESFKLSQDALRQAAQDQIKAVQAGTKDQIKAAQEAAKAQIEAVQQAAKDQIKAAQDNVAQQIKDLNDPDKNLAMKSLKDAAVADLQALQKTAEEAKAGAEKAAGDAAKAAEKYKTDTLNALKAIADKAEQTRAEAALQYADAKLAAQSQFNQAYQAANSQLITLGLIGGFNAAQNAALTAIAQQMIPGWSPPGVTSIQAYAKGGYAQSGLALVGEQGPELVRFERPAQVLTAQQTREALNGESPKTFAALEAIKQELKAIVTTQSNANPQLIERLAAIEDRLNKMERNQRLQA